MNVAGRMAEGIYNAATQVYKDDHRQEYRRYEGMCQVANRNLRRLHKANAYWSDEGDGWRYSYDYAVAELVALDRGAHDAAMVALRMAGCHDNG